MIEPRAITDMGIARIQDVPAIRGLRPALREYDWVLMVTHDGESTWALLTDQLVERGISSGQRLWEWAFDDALGVLEKQAA